MKYKVIQFDQSEDVPKALQAIINLEARDGYKYINHEYSDKLIPGSIGFFGIGFQPDINIHVGFVIFGKE
ncbi:hypothetical protein [Dokdonia sp.]|uniref:hypothetical protein n=1 Tax=Dokdonia sp. TaxID=2024995 RepID=UPI003267D56B